MSPSRPRSRAATYVVDASAAAKQFLEEPERGALMAWLADARVSGAHLVAPPLLRYELGNCMAAQVRRGVEWTPEERAAILEGALLGFAFADPQGVEPLSPPLSYYDASYLALAKATAATLVTYDDDLAEAARDARIEVIAPGT